MANCLGFKDEAQMMAIAAIAMATNNRHTRAIALVVSGRVLRLTHRSLVGFLVSESRG
jgi:hypothetical protein